MTEQDVMHAIENGVTDIAVLFRVNVGKGRTYDGRHFETGVPPGYPDLSGFRLGDVKAVFIEVKTATGRVRPEQTKFLNKMREYGAIAGVARSVEDARKIIQEEI